MLIRSRITAALLAAFLPAAPALASDAPEPFVASGDSAAFERSLQCLTEAVYYEARSQSDDGQRAVAQVVLNRVRHPAYPNSVCGVVYQGSERATGCQFTFTCDGSLGGGIEPYAWDRARRIAAAALRGSVYRPVGLATNYHTTAISPYWAPSLVPQITLGDHIFYRRPGSGTAEAFSQAAAADDPDWAPQPRREARGGGGRSAPTLVYEMPVLATVLVERPLRYRTIGPRRAAAPAASTARPAPRAAAARTGPRLTIESGIRVFRGGGSGAAD
ncbi:MAG TPA: cell wall hydrolase [Allosphingosinicella sp.]|nr:cell wall hydrolase [Allosphingosinicella sp.]